MGYQVIKQPNGKLAVFSSYSDQFIWMNAEPREIIEWFAAGAYEEAEERTQKIIDNVLNDNPRASYAQFAHTYEEAVAMHTEHGGKPLEELVDD